MAPAQGSCTSGLLKLAGFNLCGCECLDEHAGVGIQICMTLPTPQIGSPTGIGEDYPTVVPAVGENDKALAAPKGRLAGDIDNRNDRVVKETQKAAKSRESKLVLVEGLVSSDSSALINRINERQRAQHSGGNDTLVSNFRGRARANPSAESASTGTPHGQPVPAEGPVSSDPSALIKRINERQRAQHSGGNDKFSNFRGRAPAWARARATPSAENTATATPHRHSIDKTGSNTLASSNTSADARPAANNTRLPGTFPKKLYCMYWIRTGQCDFMQTGCGFKHEIPEDEETRQRIGLREIPAWIRQSPADFGPFLNRSANEISTSPATNDQRARPPRTKPRTRTGKRKRSVQSKD